MTLYQLFFQFYGRIPRKLFIFSFLFLFCLQISAASWLLQFTELTTQDYIKRISPKSLGFDLMINVLFIWPQLAIAVKRLHDIGWSGLGYVVLYLSLLLLYFLGLTGAFTSAPQEHSGFMGSVAILGLASLVFLVMMVFIPGVRGDNQFGPDPL